MTYVNFTPSETNKDDAPVILTRAVLQQMWWHAFWWGAIAGFGGAMLLHVVTG